MKRSFFQGLLVILFFITQYFWYSTQHLSIDEIPALCKEYGINELSDNWYAEKHTKNTIINRKEPMIHLRNMISLFPNEIAIVNVYVTHGEELIETVLPFSPYLLACQTMIMEKVKINEVVIQVEVITPSKKEAYTPTYRLTFLKDGNLYRIQFYISGDRADRYEINEEQLHFDVFDKYLEYTSSLFNLNS